MVLQPSWTAGAPLDFRVLGFQSWLAQRLVALGFEGATCLLSDQRPPAPKRLVAGGRPTDEQTHKLLIDSASTYGVLSEFRVLGSDAQTMRLEAATLVKVDRDVLAEVARVRLDGDNDVLPIAAHQLLEHLLGKLGSKQHPGSWQAMFETEDPAVATSYLTALGVHAMCSEGILCENPERALKILISAIVARSGPAIALLPLMVASLWSSQSAPPEMLRSAVSATLGVIVPTPPAWSSMLRVLGLSPRTTA